MTRILLTSVYRPFCVDEPFDSPQNLVQHGTVHRQFTREQGIFAIHQQNTNLGLHLIAANVDAETDVVEYPSLEEFRGFLQRAVDEGRPYDYVGVTCSASYVRKARHLCEITKEISPSTRTVVGGGGVMAIGELVEPFSDHACKGDGVRFFRQLLGQDPEAPFDHPPIWSVHRPNEVFGFRGNAAAYSLAVTLGCERGCEFCATSAQFEHKRIRLLKTGDEILAAMKRVRSELEAEGKKPAFLQFVIFDENFLPDEALARRFLELNRHEVEQGNLYLPFLFADAASVKRFTPEELLEMGVDALWIGMESSSSRASGVFRDKNDGIDFKGLVQKLQAHGIKVVVSFMCGLEEQTEASIRQDIEAALEIGAVGYQYAVVCPMPGTAYYNRMKEAGILNVERPEQINMSHYYLRHPELDEKRVRSITREFHRRDYERHGPMALRFIRIRMEGYERHRDSERAALRHRALAFRNEFMDSFPSVTVCRTFSPSPVVARLVEETIGDARRLVPVRPMLRDMAKGRIAVSTVVRFVAFTNPLTEPVARRWLTVRCLRWDPRSRDRCATLPGLIRHGRACIEEITHGMMPWEQPTLEVSHYPRKPAKKPVKGVLNRLIARFQPVEPPSIVPRAPSPVAGVDTWKE